MDKREALDEYVAVYAIFQRAIDREVLAAQILEGAQEDFDRAANALRELEARCLTLRDAILGE